jgi:hypothetical protein
MVERCVLNSSGSGQGHVVDCCEHGNEPSGSKRWKISWLDEWLLASKEGFCSMKLDSYLVSLRLARDSCRPELCVRILVSGLCPALLTYCIVQDIIWKADCHSPCQKISCFLMEPEGSWPCSQNPDTGPYPEPAESSSPHRFISP